MIHLAILAEARIAPAIGLFSDPHRVLGHGGAVTWHRHPRLCRSPAASGTN